MSGYYATVDSPGCDVYLDLMTLYPKAKVILSVRDSDVAWWKSFSGTIAVILTRQFRWLTYPIPILRAVGLLMQAVTQQWMRLAGTDTLGPSIHRLHNQAVQSNVPHEKLLVFNVKMGWKPLCEFLDVPVPEEPFPNLSVILKHLIVPLLIINNPIVGMMPRRSPRLQQVDRSWELAFGSFTWHSLSRSCFCPSRPTICYVLSGVLSNSADSTSETVLSRPVCFISRIHAIR